MLLKFIQSQSKLFKVCIHYTEPTKNERNFEHVWLGLHNLQSYIMNIHFTVLKYMNKSEVAWFFLSMRKNSYLRFLPDFLLTLLETHPSQMLLTVHQSTLTITGNSKVKTSLRLIFYFLFGLEREKLYWETLIISGNSSPNFCSWLKKYKSARLANLDNQLSINFF